MPRRSKRQINTLTIEYGSLGTVSLEEFTQALWEDIQTLKDFYGVKFITGAALVVPVTTEFGAPLLTKSPDGSTVHSMPTQRYRPACLDYRL